MNTQYGTVVPSNPAPYANDVDYVDRLEVHNQYFVPQVGLAAGANYNRFFLDAACKVGLGWVHIDAKAEGSTTQSSAIGSITQSGGLLVPPVGLTAGGNRFAVVPELTIAAGYELTSWCRVTIGYDFLFASQVVRAGNLIGGVDALHVPQLATFDGASASKSSSTTHLQGTTFWVQGLTAGLELHF